VVGRIHGKVADPMPGVLERVDLVARLEPDEVVKHPRVLVENVAAADRRYAAGGRAEEPDTGAPRSAGRELDRTTGECLEQRLVEVKAVGALDELRNEVARRPRRALDQMDAAVFELPLRVEDTVADAHAGQQPAIRGEHRVLVDRVERCRHDMADLGEVAAAHRRLQGDVLEHRTAPAPEALDGNLSAADILLDHVPPGELPRSGAVALVGTHALLKGGRGLFDGVDPYDPHRSSSVCRLDHDRHITDEVAYVNRGLDLGEAGLVDAEPGRSTPQQQLVAQYPCGMLPGRAQPELVSQRGGADDGVLHPGDDHVNRALGVPGAHDVGVLVDLLVRRSPNLGDPRVGERLDARRDRRLLDDEQLDVRTTVEQIEVADVQADHQYAHVTLPSTSSSALHRSPFQGSGHFLPSLTYRLMLGIMNFGRLCWHGAAPKTRIRRDSVTTTGADQPTGLVVFLDLNLTGTATAAMRLAAELGYSTLLMTRDRTEYAGMDPDPLEVADEVVDVDTFDVSAVVRECLVRRPVAVVAFDDYRLLPAAAVRGTLGLPGPSPWGIAGARFKDETRRRTASRGRLVRHTLVSIDDAPPTSPVGYPCVVKPTDDSASAGVRLCTTDEEYCSAVAGAVDHRTHGRAYRCAEAVLVEEAVPGDEYSAELVWEPDSRDWTLVGLTQTFLSPAPWRRETGHLFPAPVDEIVYAAIEACVLGWLDDIGLKGGVAHVELKYGVDGPALIEVNPRPAGGNIPTLVEHCTGVDLVARYLELHLPNPRPLAVPPPEGAAALRFVVAGRPGVLRTLATNAPYDVPVPGLLKRALRSELVGSNVGATSRLGHVIATADHADQAWELVTQLHGQVVVDVADGLDD